jgi:hypothetical protein
MKDNRMKDALENIARGGVPKNTNLWPRIESRLDKRSSLMQTLRARPVMMIAIVLLALALLTGVAYAVGKSLGYLPGFGLVEQGTQIRVLKEPVSITRDGVTVTVKNAIITSDKTDIGYFVSGVPRSAEPEGEAATGGCIKPPYLRLPDGTKMEVVGNMPPIPADVNEAVFVMPCIGNTLPGTVPENWELPLQFIPAPPELMVIPVTEILPLPETNSTVAMENPLVITKVLDIGNSFVLMGEFRYGALGTVSHDNVFADGSWWWVKNVNVMDASGQEIPNAINNDIEWPTPQPNAETWVYQIDKNFVPPLMISYEVAHVIPVGSEEQAEFEFDAGTNPQDGDMWVMNKDLTMGGYNIRLVSITLNRDGYDFNFKADPGTSANAISMEIVGHPPYCGGGGGGEEFPEEFTRAVCYGGAVPVPNGKLKAILRFQALRRENKTFQLVWSPPEPYATPTPQAGICLTLEKWNQLAGRNDPLPSGLGGKILTTVNEGGPWPGIYVSNLDGTDSRKIDLGTWPSLSTDGTRLAYSIGDGIHVFNFSTGEIPALGTDGYRIIWSPDSTRLMFTTTFALYVVNADGSGLRQIDTVPTQVIAPTGWLPDNQTLVYAAMGGEGFTFTTYNLLSGETKSLFTIQNKAGYGAISADGQWIVFADHLPGEMNWGIFISHLDGSERKMVAEPQVPTAFASVWSPDGQWLIVNTQDAKQRHRAVLVNPFTCQVLSLNNVNGMMEGWSP